MERDAEDETREQEAECAEANMRKSGEQADSEAEEKGESSDALPSSAFPTPPPPAARPASASCDSILSALCASDPARVSLFALLRGLLRLSSARAAVPPLNSVAWQSIVRGSTLLHLGNVGLDSMQYVRLAALLRGHYAQALTAIHLLAAQQPLALIAAWLGTGELVAAPLLLSGVLSSAQAVAERTASPSLIYAHPHLALLVVFLLEELTSDMRKQGAAHGHCQRRAARTAPKQADRVSESASDATRRSGRDGGARACAGRSDDDGGYNRSSFAARCPPRHSCTCSR
jgi:hypothetical protein